MDLFDTSLLSAVSCPAPFVVRALRTDDFEKDFLNVLAQLTQVGNVTNGRFLDRFVAMKKTNSVSPTYFVVVVEDTSRKVVVGTATLVLEQKFIRGASVAGHVEDVVTDKSVRGKGIGKVLMEALLSLSRQMGCYKTMLDCDEKNVPFYSQFGFKPKERQMAIYFEQQQKSKL